MRGFPIFLVLLFGLLFSCQSGFAASAELVDPADLLPKSVNNFYMDPPTWHSFAAKSLYEYMNGGAEIFLEYGFDRGCVAEYTNGDKKLVVELFKMKTADAAYGLYTMSNYSSTVEEQRSKAYKIEKPEQKVSKDLKGENYNLIGDTAVEFFKANIYGRIAIDGEDRFTLMSFANKIMSQIPKQASRPKAMTNLPTLDRIPGSERYAVGLVGMTQILDLQKGDIYGIQSGVQIVAGEFRLSPGVYYSMLVICYRNETIADDKYKSLKDMFNKWEDYTPTVTPQISSKQDVFLVRTPENDYIGFRFLGMRIEIFSGLKSPSHFKMLLEKDPSISVTIPE
jgi:hypothetical protein